MKKIAVLYTEYSPIIDIIKYHLSDCEIQIMTTPTDMGKYDYVILSNYEKEYSGNAILCHHSLLPAFDTETPVKDAFISGVKVTGITICYTNPRKIIAQYPVFIKYDMHYDELKQELSYLEQTLFPIILEKIIKRESFEIDKIVKKGCAKNCGGCLSCSH